MSDIGRGQMLTCPECGARYWSEDGHPIGTGCPSEEIVEEVGLPCEDGFCTCSIHGTRFWWEDGCPDCMQEEQAFDSQGRRVCPNCHSSARVGSATGHLQHYCYECCTTF